MAKLKLATVAKIETNWHKGDNNPYDLTLNGGLNGKKISNNRKD